MINKLFKRAGLIVIFAMLVTGCQTIESYDYTALKKSKPRSIVIIPPNNNSTEVNAPYLYLSTLTKPLAEKGYYVLPVAVIDQFLKENGLPTPAEMNNIPLDKIDKHIGADAVLYITINEWGQKFMVISSVTTVSADLKLVDVKTGAVLWESTAVATRDSGDGGGGLAGMLINAIITQVMTSSIDSSYETAMLANLIAINHKSKGLLDGPYKISTK
ncbi:lipoprotein, putative [uncultured Candidatus Thioglobus sp.]|nr:lipoprotein, putative [uncultured Candidatus Thioglobus sp.]